MQVCNRCSLKWCSIKTNSSISCYWVSVLGSLRSLWSTKEHLIWQRSRQQDRYQELWWSACFGPAAEEDQGPGPHWHYHRSETHCKHTNCVKMVWTVNKPAEGISGRTGWTCGSQLFNWIWHFCIVFPQGHCGTCHPTTLWKWRLWTMRCMPSLMRWWCPIQAGSEGATEQEEGRRTASPDILSGRLRSPTQQAAWGMEG